MARGHERAGRSCRALVALLFVGLLGPLRAQDPGPNPPVPVQDPPKPEPTPPEPQPTPEPEPKPESGQDPAPPAAAPAQAEPAPAPPASKPKPPLWEARYHTPAEIDGFLAALASSDSPLAVEPLELGSSPQGHVVRGVTFGSSEGGPLSGRPTVFLVGGLDGLSLSGSEAVLAACAELFAHAAELPPGVAICALPAVAIDALELARTGQCDGRDRTPLDDDGDGRPDEDGGDDLDGDGHVLEMLLEDPEGEWTRSSDARLLAPARASDAPRFRRLLEGRDDDGDGVYNEDPPGGIDLDRSFPVGWDRRESGPWVRPLPLSAPLARALADLWLARRSVLVLLFQGDHGEIAFADAALASPSALDGLACEALTGIVQRASSRSWLQPRTLTTVHGASHPGLALDWIHEVVGALGAEVSFWGPQVESSATGRAVGVADARLAAPARPENGPPPPAESDQAWLRWLDNTRGGIGFSDWHPVELGAGRTALVGGFDPALRRNPPEKSLAPALASSGATVLECLRALPVLDLRLVDRKRDGEVCTIRVRVENKGRLPTGLSTSARWSAAVAGGARGARLEAALVLPPGARLLAGEERVALGELAGGASSREVRWVATAPANSVFQVAIESPFGASVRREVKP